MKRLQVLLGLCLLLSVAVNSFAVQNEILAIKGGRIYTITNGIIEDGVLLIQNERIIALGDKVVIPDNARIIDASGLSVMPGLIDAFTNLGTADIGEIHQDYDETSDPVLPQLRIIDALNPDNRFISLARKFGITTILCAPGEGNLLSGQSALVNLAGGKLEEMIVKFPVGVHANLGETPKMRYGPQGRYPMTRMGEIALLRRVLIQTQEYLRKKSRVQAAKEQTPAIPFDFKYEAMLPVVKGDLPLIVRANRMDDILSALRIADEFKIKIVLNHGAEAYRVADRLAARHIPVLVGPYAENHQRFETSNAQAKNAVILYKTGVKIAFQTGSFKNFADLLNQAEMAVAYGLPAKEALRALTYYPAQIFGIENSLGSLEKGKAANLMIFDGFPFKETVKVKMVIIAGHVVEDLVIYKSKSGDGETR